MLRRLLTSKIRSLRKRSSKLNGRLFNGLLKISEVHNYSARRMWELAFIFIEIIETLSSQYQTIIKIFRNKGTLAGMNREDFGELLIYLGLGAEKSLGDKLFL